MDQIQCYRCHAYGHYAIHCPTRLQPKLILVNQPRKFKSRVWKRTTHMPDSSTLVNQYSEPSPVSSSNNATHISRVSWCIQPFPKCFGLFKFKLQSILLNSKSFPTAPILYCRLFLFGNRYVIWFYWKSSMKFNYLSLFEHLCFFNTMCSDHRLHITPWTFKLKKPHGLLSSKSLYTISYQDDDEVFYFRTSKLALRSTVNYSCDRNIAQLTETYVQPNTPE